MSMPSFMYHFCIASCKVTVTFLDGFVHMWLIHWLGSRICYHGQSGLKSLTRGTIQTWTLDSGLKGGLDSGFSNGLHNKKIELELIAAAKVLTYVLRCHQLGMFITCTLLSSRRFFWGNNLAQSLCFSPNKMSVCGLIKMNYSSSVSRDWKYANTAGWQLQKLLQINIQQ